MQMPVECLLLGKVTCDVADLPYRFISKDCLQFICDLCNAKVFATYIYACTNDASMKSATACTRLSHMSGLLCYT